MTIATKLTGEQIDDLCMSFDSAKIAADLAAQKVSEAKGELLSAIRAQGYTPAHAEKTTRLEGQLYTADATEGSTIEINEASVAELQSELSRLKKPAVFKKLFTRRVSHRLAAKDGTSVLNVALGHLKEEEQQRILGLFASCFTVGIKAPSVSVQLTAAIQEKEAKAAKRGKKAGSRAKSGA